MTIEPFADNFVPIISSDVVHDETYPFCWDKLCPCHEDNEAIAQVNHAVEDGLITPDEATDFVSGKLL